jgi:hypothetical protein
MKVPNFMQVVGWAVAQRSQGGINHVALAQQTGKWACQACIQIRQSRNRKKQKEQLF